MKIKTSHIHSSEEKYKIEQDYHYQGDDYWDWSVWVESSETGLDKIKDVIYNLHYTFPNPVRVVKTRENKFRFKTSGWGTFTIYVLINFHDDTVLELEHELDLQYPDESGNSDIETPSRGSEQ